MNSIRPEIIAGKLLQIRNGEPSLAEQIQRQPRLVEMLWFVQFKSMQPGGLEKFAEQMIEKLPERFMSKGQLEAGPPKDNGRYTMDQCFQVWKAQLEETVSLGDSFSDWACLYLDHSTLESMRRAGAAHRKDIQADVKRFNYDYFYGTWREHALQRLLDDLAALRHADVKRVFADKVLQGALFGFMDWHTQETRKQIAETRVTRKVFDELEFALESKVPVPIVGESRLGKTTSVSIWCEMRPGAARLVTVPESNRERDFYAAHADAFGLDYTPATPISRLKADVEFIYRHSGLFCVYDEAQFLIPQNYTRNTPPQRLNWVRCQVIDRELGCAFFATPQTYRQTVDQFSKLTGYRMEQWLGRLAPPVLLPADLEWEDALAVARKNFADVPEDFLQLITARAQQTAAPLKSLEIAAKRARYLAHKEGRNAITLSDVEAALVYITPTAPVSRASRKPAPFVQPQCTGSASALQPGLDARISIVRQSDALNKGGSPVESAMQLAEV